MQGTYVQQRMLSQHVNAAWTHGSQNSCHHIITTQHNNIQHWNASLQNWMWTSLPLLIIAKSATTCAFTSVCVCVMGEDQSLWYRSILEKPCGIFFSRVVNFLEALGVVDLFCKAGDCETRMENLKLFRNLNDEPSGKFVDVKTKWKTEIVPEWWTWWKPSTEWKPSGNPQVFLERWTWWKSWGRRTGKSWAILVEASGNSEVFQRWWTWKQFRSHKPCTKTETCRIQISNQHLYQEQNLSDAEAFSYLLGSIIECGQGENSFEGQISPCQFVGWKS